MSAPTNRVRLQRVSVRDICSTRWRERVQIVDEAGARLSLGYFTKAQAVALIKRSGWTLTNPEI